MKTLTLDVPDELYDAFNRAAAKDGRTVEAVVLEFLTNHAPSKHPDLTDEARRAAWRSLLKHAGAVKSGDPHSADNERIDADLAREYADNHEDGT